MFKKALKQSGDVEHFSKILVDAKDQTTGVTTNNFIKRL
jgi:hypothetical protein